MAVEGVDYSSTANDDWDRLATTLHDNGKRFAGRYSVADKSPNGRGITGDEYRSLMSHGIDVFLYYEEDAGWMMGGWEAGVRGANRALTQQRDAGMPPGMPVYYSDDNPPETDDFDAVIECLKGAASVVGFARVGLYGGWDALQRAHDANAAAWYTQTSAWEYGRGIHPFANLYQYAYNQWFAGTNCDLVQGLKQSYGGAREFLVTPTTTTTPKPYPQHRIPVPDTMTAQGYPVSVNKPNRFLCTQGGRFKTAPSLQAPNATATPYKAGKTYTFDYATVTDGVVWLASKSGSWAPVKNFEPVR